MKYVLLILGLFLGTPALAESGGLTFGGWSHHFKGGDWNEEHEVLGVEWNGWSAMSFTNSYGEDAVGVAYYHSIESNRRLDYGIYGGVWSGYEEINDTGVIPVVSARATVTVAGPLAVDVYLNPIVSALAIKWRF